MNMAGSSAYDALLAAFQRSQDLPAEGWSGRAAERVRTPAALHGRHKLRDALLGLGFRLE